MRVVSKIGLMALTMGLVAAANATTIDSLNLTADYDAFEAGGNVAPSNNTGGIGGSANSANNKCVYFVYALPVLPSGEALTNAHMQFVYTGYVGAPNFNVDLYACGTGTSIASTDVIKRYNESDLPEDPASIKVQDNILTTSTLNLTSGQTTNSVVGSSALGDAALATYLTTFYATNPTYAGGTYLFLRLSADADPGTQTVNTTFNIKHQESSQSGKITLTTAATPEPASLGVCALGAMAMGMRNRKRSV